MTKVCIVHWCQGAGHAARSIPVAQELEERGCDVSLEGGGPGQIFTEMNGYGSSTYEFEQVPVIDKSLRSVIVRGLAEVLPSALKRLRTSFQFLRDEEPDLIITDDHTTIIAASLMRKKFYTVNHVRPDFFNGLEKLAADLFDSFSTLAGNEIFFTCLWSHEEGKDSVEYVNPLAQQGEGDVEPYDVLLIPGSFGSGFSELRDRLEKKNLDVRTVGDDDWETKPSMSPYTEAAGCVVCTGFSSIADSVVANTPCVVYPNLHMQEKLAQQIDRRNISGIETAYSEQEVIDSVTSMLKSSYDTPQFSNGAKEIADYVLDHEEHKLNAGEDAQ